MGRPWRRGLYCGLAGLLLTLGGCSDRGTEPVPVDDIDSGPTVSFANDLQPVFTGQCVGCHGVGGNGGMNLTSAVAWDNLVGVESQGYAPMLRVMAGNPEMSVIYLKLSGAAGVGSRMPLGGMLDAATVEMVRMWILEGALDN